MRRVLLFAGLFSVLLSSPAWAGATSLNSDGRLVWEFRPRPTGADRNWSGTIGYACRIDDDGSNVTIDRYSIQQQGGSDYQYLEPLEGLRLVNGVVSASEPMDEEHILARAVLTEGGFWYADNAPSTAVGDVCLRWGVEDAMDEFRR